MHSTCRAIVPVFTAFLAGMPAMAQQAPMPGMETHGRSAAGGPADEAMMAGMRTMQQAMDGAPMTGDPDRDFVAMMIPHHQGAIAMARTELQYGKDPTLRRLAQDIVAAQEKEIAGMHGWQAAHKAP